ncbi:hypothetical protein [Streptomyces sp. NRRL F-5755]|uniref:hypothetical protein n=1 Tax=Streptomyces sp. NRRL F-5755 TaxID=1519475 RepID=UPI000A56FE9F|nr:hypothetical protein [Streptomyces sp. NRRL F-5755]
MEPTAFPEPLRHSIQQYVAETVSDGQEALYYLGTGVHGSKRMTLYRLTDAAGTMNMAALLFAAYC